MKKFILILLVLLGLQTQAQIVYCDSISYTATTSNTIGYPLILAGYLPNIPGDVTWEWGVCTNEFCYPGSGINAIFQPFEMYATMFTLMLVGFYIHAQIVITLHLMDLLGCY